MNERGRLGWGPPNGQAEAGTGRPSLQPGSPRRSGLAVWFLGPSPIAVAWLPFPVSVLTPIPSQGPASLRQDHAHVCSAEAHTPGSGLLCLDGPGCVWGLSFHNAPRTGVQGSLHDELLPATTLHGHAQQTPHWPPSASGMLMCARQRCPHEQPHWALVSKRLPGQQPCPHVPAWSAARGHSVEPPGMAHPQDACTGVPQTPVSFLADPTVALGPVAVTDLSHEHSWVLRLTGSGFGDPENHGLASIT